MREFAQQFASLVNTLIGLAVFLAIMVWAAKIRSSRWRAVAAKYGGRGQGEPLGRLLLETLTFADRGTFTPMYGGKFDSRYMSVRITMVADGLQMDAIPLFNILRRPLFLPFAEMGPLTHEEGTFATVFALKMRRLDDMDLIIRKQVVDFVRQRTDVPPFGWGV